MRFLADADPDELTAALDLMHPPDGPVVARAGPRPEPLGGRVWVLPVAGLDGLAATVADATAALAPLERRRFTGHLTLARARRPGGLRGLSVPDVACEWTVSAVSAWRSRLRPDGARHELLGRWPLARE